MIDDRICSVCRQVLSIRTKPNGDESYEHGYQDLPSDHEASPIPMPPDYLGRCDFCNGGIPAFLVPARSFQLPYAQDEFSKGDWAACHECAPLVEQNQWNKLERRAAPDTSPEVRGALRVMYRQLRKNIYGAIRPMP